MINVLFVTDDTERVMTNLMGTSIPLQYHNKNSLVTNNVFVDVFQISLESNRSIDNFFNELQNELHGREVCAVAMKIFEKATSEKAETIKKFEHLYEGIDKLKEKVITSRVSTTLTNLIYDLDSLKKFLCQEERNRYVPAGLELTDSRLLNYMQIAKTRLERFSLNDSISVSDYLYSLNIMNECIEWISKYSKKNKAVHFDQSCPKCGYMTIRDTYSFCPRCGNHVMPPLDREIIIRKLKDEGERKVPFERNKEMK